MGGIVFKISMDRKFSLKVNYLLNNCCKYVDFVLLYLYIDIIKVIEFVGKFDDMFYVNIGNG